MKTRYLRMTPAVLAVFALGATAPAGWADEHDEEDGTSVAFDVGDVYAELNNTDGDLGFHALMDGDPWRRLSIADPRERRILDVKPKWRLRQQGLTELFFESAEPNFDDLSPEEFFARFPEGMYEIEGMTLAKETLKSEDLFWHAMSTPAVTYLSPSRVFRRLGIVARVALLLAAMPLLAACAESTDSHGVGGQGHRVSRGSARGRGDVGSRDCCPAPGRSIALRNLNTRWNAEPGRQ